TLRTVFIVHQGPELLVDRLAGAEDPRTHRADGAVHPFGDLLVAHALDLAQGDGRAQFLGQGFDRAHHGLFHLLPHQFAFRGVVVAQADAGVVLLGVGNVDIARGRAAVAGDQVVLGGIHGDTVQPRIELRVPAEA